ncbi:WecB/TagA/CpsF family glycosyltransferase [Klenkia sp. PcliD-1-E]|uniref:WecB/TagA/CpsF family glycosyltransferase n=1 Tax=Klenkia sp. PcliD-1-E TaxID=2954492 RepID=UPI0020982027|nr:WecB/TagA/CpsF family glycosyltransferase [Klenkia sp. PcliD-1-E]MCO7221267.1 WecB/TagA/CpsF family glycosyltransferase [Klenkia sp. PcliD-1-E]
MTPEGEDRDTCVLGMSAVLVDVLQNGRSAVGTWLNHYSAMQCLDGAVPLEDFDVVGIDGILLAALVGSDEPRTSADLVLPEVFERCTHLRVALIGSTPSTLAAVRAKLESITDHRVVLAVDGYAGLPPEPELRRALAESSPDLVVVGLGAPRQDHLALRLRAPRRLVVTCGGWLDQYPQDDYYPSWAYPLRLNWLVRLCREPGRLWRRYTIDAVAAVRRRKALRAFTTRSRTAGTIGSSC